MTSNGNSSGRDSGSECSHLSFVTVAVFLAVDSITGSDDEVVTVSVGFRRLPITTCFRLTIVLKLTVDNGEWP